LNEWLTLMIDEIRRKQSEQAEAEREHERRSAADSLPPPERPAGVRGDDSPSRD